MPVCSQATASHTHDHTRRLTPAYTTRPIFPEEHVPVLGLKVEKAASSQYNNIELRKVSVSGQRVKDTS